MWVGPFEAWCVFALGGIEFHLIIGVPDGFCRLSGFFSLSWATSLDLRGGVCVCHFPNGGVGPIILWNHRRSTRDDCTWAIASAEWGRGDVGKGQKKFDGLSSDIPRLGVSDAYVCKIARGLPRIALPKRAWKTVNHKSNHSRRRATSLTPTMSYQLFELCRESHFSVSSAVTCIRWGMMDVP